MSYLCQKQIGWIRGFVTTKPECKAKFSEFKKEIESFLNDGDLSNEGVLEMLGQHVVISPALDALFTTDFSKQNPLDLAMTKICEALDKEGMEKVSTRISGPLKVLAANVKIASDRQIVILELFDKFFKIALPKVQEKQGIVYMPVPIVHILVPLTGTGTFMTRFAASIPEVSE